jgi:hypothetical protein
LVTEQKNIEKEFVQRTLQIMQEYDGPYGVTLLVNCLLGLIVLPKERDFNHIAERNNLQFTDLGIEDGDIKSWGNISDEEQTVARFLRCMRNSIAHIHIESISEAGEIDSLLFIDKSGFEASLSIEKIKNMVTKLAEQVQ